MIQCWLLVLLLDCYRNQPARWELGRWGVWWAGLIWRCRYVAYLTVLFPRLLCKFVVNKESTGHCSFGSCTAPRGSTLWRGHQAIISSLFGLHSWHAWKLSVQIHPWDTLACCWDVKQPTNKQTNPHLPLPPLALGTLITQGHSFNSSLISDTASTQEYASFNKVLQKTTTTNTLVSLCLRAASSLTGTQGWVNLQPLTHKGNTNHWRSGKQSETKSGKSFVPAQSI